MSPYPLRNRAGGTRLLVVLAILGLATVSWLVLWSLRRASAPPDNGREIAAAFLADIRNHRVDAAWEGTTAEFKSFLGRERLHAFVRSQPVLKADLAFSESQEREANGIRLLAYTFRAASPAAAVQVLLAKEQGHWKVERVTVE
jgi:hypothetical protein